MKDTWKEKGLTGYPSIANMLYMTISGTEILHWIFL